MSGGWASSNISPSPFRRPAVPADKVDLCKLELFVSLYMTSDERSCIQSRTAPATVNANERLISRKFYL